MSQRRKITKRGVLVSALFLHAFLFAQPKPIEPPKPVAPFVPRTPPPPPSFPPPKFPANATPPPPAPKPAPLPDWYVEGVKKVDALAEEFASDRAALIAAWNQRRGPGDAAVSPGFGGPITLGVDSPPQPDRFYFEENFRDIAAGLKYNHYLLGRYDGANVAMAHAGDREWQTGEIAALEQDLAEWRRHRGNAEKLMSDWFAARDAKLPAEVADRAAQKALSQHPDVDEERFRLQYLADSADAILRRQSLLTDVAVARLLRLQRSFTTRAFSLYFSRPPALVARPEVGRLPYTQALVRLEAKIAKLEDAEMKIAQRAKDADSTIFLDAAEVLKEAVSELDEWSMAWSAALDLPVDELEKLEKMADDVLRQTADLEPPFETVEKDLAQKRATEKTARADQRAAEALGQQASALSTAGDSAGADAVRAQQNAKLAQLNEDNQKASQLEQDTRPTFEKLNSLRYHRLADRPAPNRLIAIVAELGWELLATDPATAKPDRTTTDPLAHEFLDSHLVLGRPFHLTPLLSGQSGAVRWDGTAEAGMGARPVTLATATENWNQRQAERVLLVSEEADRLLSQPPPQKPPPPSEVEVKPRTRDSHQPPSPIEGKWNVIYADGALGWVKGEAQVSFDGLTAEVEFTHPKTNEKYKVVIDEIRHEADGTYAFDYRGQQPHLDARLGPPVKGNGSDDKWLLNRPNGGPIPSTPPVPDQLPRIVVKPGATELHLSFGEQKTTFRFAPAITSPPGPISVRIRPIDTAWGGWGYSDAFDIVKWGREHDESLQGIWTQPVDATTRQPTGIESRYRLLYRDAANPNLTKEVGVEIWWRGLAAKIQLLAQTVSGPVKVSRLFRGVPTLIEAVFDDPQTALTKELTLSIDGAEQKLTVKRDPNDYRRYTTELLLPGGR